MERLALAWWVAAVAYHEKTNCAFVAPYRFGYGKGTVKCGTAAGWKDKCVVCLGGGLSALLQTEKDGYM